MKTYTRSEIESVCNVSVLMQAIEEGFANREKAIQAPVSFLNLPDGEVHIKSGAFLDDDMYVVKIASGFYKVSPSSNGAMLLFSQKTGELLALLHDEGRLTDIRTGLTGAIAAKHLAPPLVHKIGIIGTGTQAKEQLKHLALVTPCKDVLVWGRDKEKAKQFANEFNIKAVKTIDEITDQCQLIVTTTPSTSPLLFGHQIKPGTHITAVGADEKGKQELDSTVFECADLIAVDSLSQASSYGDLSHSKNIDLSRVFQLGVPLKREPHWITVADLTGTAITDQQVAKVVFKSLSGNL